VGQIPVKSSQMSLLIEQLSDRQTIASFWPLDERCPKVTPTRCAYVDTNFPCTFSILNGVKIKITHNIAPINLHSSINVTGVTLCANGAQFV